MRKFILASLLLISHQAFAQADLDIRLTGATALNANSLSTYSVRVANLGNVVVRNGSLSLAIPQGSQVTSVSVSGLNAALVSCRVQSNNLICGLGRVYLGLNQAYNIIFNLTAPAVTSVLALNAVGMHGAADRNQANNSANLAVSITAPVIVPEPTPIVPTPPPLPTYQVTLGAGDVISMRTCIAATQTTAYSQCSHQSIDVGTFNLLANGIVDMSVDPSATGTYSQASLSQISMVFRDAQTQQILMEFAGTAVSSSCFEGLATDIANNGDQFAFRVCK